MLEEINDEDIDDMDYDPAEFDPRNPFAKGGPAGRGALVPVEPPVVSSHSSADIPLFPSSSVEPIIPLKNANFIQNEKDMDQFKDWQLIYPIYFDASRSLNDGRRVSIKNAVKNPLAQTIMDACQDLGVSSVYESHKTHPKDWANPGRVRVLLKNSGEDLMPPSVSIKNKRHLFLLISDHLKKHPPNAETPFKSPVYQQMIRQPGYEPPSKLESKPFAVPRGWKINDILPVTSSALNAGEMTDQMVKQMQEQMFPALNAPEIKPKKIKIRAK